MQINKYQNRATGVLQEFKAFALKGNVLDLAVAVVVGTAFNKIVSSLVDNIIMPLFGIVTGGVDFKGLSVSVGDTVLTYGVFLQSVIDFLIIAWAIFVAIKVLRSLERKEKAKPESEKEVEPTEEVQLLREIRDALRRG
jgi:large conductance mechanosensitive channel